MKKIIALILALVMVFALAACGTQTNTPDPTKTPEATNNGGSEDKTPEET